ncbi:hypothetical protein GUITHDRAFT_103200 [Guillardia theta CCMP2712]|uniref:Uncharacterized protein n=1 Tax=Guillardia theta (strain CCMP2712) TaxID=905079 RepID=L1JT97_GUITC|nr:hypothetical protein GUITHDRAFT_103200 [Guillardia theta CCMP2712]EKX51283.1 hypothetical protein GUITHDRAFT_103200 [Guillardia theta CCMP2712]|eukprot:XP_005838263.1 hypothetical protein GUITHDRAFT_103200 [Guillardia theta CCMP2712]
MHLLVRDSTILLVLKDGYRDGYKRTGKPESKRGLVDRAAYMSFLETQLERVTASCKTVEAYNCRLNTIQDSLAHLDSKVSNNTKLISIAHSFAEQVDDEMKRFKNVYNNKFDRMSESVSSILDIHQQLLGRLEKLEARHEEHERSLLHMEKEDSQASIERASTQLRELGGSINDMKHETSLDRDKIRQVVAEMSRLSSDSISRTDLAISRMQSDMSELESRVNVEIRRAALDSQEAEQQLSKHLDVSLQALPRALQEVDAMRMEIVRLDNERLKLKDLMLNRLKDVDEELRRCYEKKIESSSLLLRPDRSHANDFMSSHDYLDKDASRHEASKSRRREDTWEAGEQGRGAAAGTRWNVGEKRDARLTEEAKPSYSEIRSRSMSPQRSMQLLDDTRSSLELRKEERRRRLKELYDELSSLEIEESHFRK